MMRLADSSVCNCCYLVICLDGSIDYGCWGSELLHVLQLHFENTILSLPSVFFFSSLGYPISTCCCRWCISLLLGFYLSFQIQSGFIYFLGGERCLGESHVRFSLTLYDRTGIILGRWIVFRVAAIMLSYVSSKQASKQAICALWHWYLVRSN